MRTLRFTLLFLVLLHSAFSQQLSEKELHDLATDRIADVLFEPLSPALRARHTSFEKVNNVKLHFTVEDSSIDRLGGLSEHLFKIYKTVVSPVNVNKRTITGEFSVLDEGVLSDLVKYRTSATADLRSCRLPLAETEKLDSNYTAVLDAQSQNVGNLGEYPSTINGVLLQAGYDYERIMAGHPRCEEHSITNYNMYAANTTAARAAKWHKDVNDITMQISGNLLLFGNSETGFNQGSSSNSGNTGINLNIDPNNLTGRHIINLNNSLNSCTERDMEVRCRMLYKKMGIRYLFLTKSLSYFLPHDSLNVFRDAATSNFENNSGQLIIALYLKMSDPISGKDGITLLVKQVNGEWLSNADIAFAGNNNGGTYTTGTFFRFNNLFKNIPKPLTICYQVAKVNGMLTTTYLNKGQTVKGREQMYYHIFKIDKAFDILAGYRSEIIAIQSLIGSAGGSTGGVSGLGNYTTLKGDIVQLRLKQKLAYLKAARAPEFDEAEVHFKEAYLQNKELTQAAALKHLKENYGSLYPGNQIDALVANAAIPSDINAGTCPANENSDVIADVLGASSLLLSFVALDCIPDALSVAYFAATDQTLEMFMASASFFLPGSLSGAKRLISNTGDALTSINKGSKLLLEGGVTKAIDPDIGHMSAFFGLEPSLVDAALVSRINSNPTITKKLIADEGSANLPVTAAQARIWKNTEELPAPKRTEFVKKCYDDGNFRQKVLDDPEEVLVFGGLLARGVKKDEFLKSVPEFAGNANLGEQAWDLFRNENWVGLENLVNTHTINRNWPPNDGFINVEIINLQVGHEIDRYGGRIVNSKFVDDGKFAADKGSSFESRALPQNYLSEMPYKKYKVVKEIKGVKRGKSIPWFGAIGEGRQYKTPVSISELLEQGFIVEL